MPYFSSNASPKMPTTSSIEVEPSVETVALFCDEQAERVDVTKIAASMIKIIFFIFISPLSLSPGVQLYFSSAISNPLPRFCKINVKSAASLASIGNSFQSKILPREKISRMHAGFCLRARGETRGILPKRASCGRSIGCKISLSYVFMTAKCAQQQNRLALCSNLAVWNLVGE